MNGGGNFNKNQYVFMIGYNCLTFLEYIEPSNF